jgi:hypothetical protein
MKGNDSSAAFNLGNIRRACGRSVAVTRTVLRANRLFAGSACTPIRVSRCVTRLAYPAHDSKFSWLPPPPHRCCRAVQFENLAAAETDPNFKERLENQAKAYRQLAAKRAQELGLPPPSPPSG